MNTLNRLVSLLANTAAEQAVITTALANARPGRTGREERIARAALEAHRANLNTRWEKNGLSFQSIARAMDWSNICSYIHEELALFLREENVRDEESRIYIATHSIGMRRWKFKEGRNIPFFPEGKEGGWFVVREGDAEELRAESATSGSILIATVQEDGRWSLVLKVPLDSEGLPYKGAYAEAFWGCEQPRDPGSWFIRAAV